MAQRSSDDLVRKRGDHMNIVLRDTVKGREAFVAGTRLKVWQIESLARAYDYDVVAVAKHLELDPAMVEAALCYVHEHRDEIEAAVADNASYDEARLRAEVPNLIVFAVPDDTGEPSHPGRA